MTINLEPGGITFANHLANYINKPNSNNNCRTCTLAVPFMFAVPAVWSMDTTHNSRQLTVKKLWFWNLCDSITITISAKPLSRFVLANTVSTPTLPTNSKFVSGNFNFTEKYYTLFPLSPHLRVFTRKLFVQIVRWL